MAALMHFIQSSILARSLALSLYDVCRPGTYSPLLLTFAALILRPPWQINWKQFCRRRRITLRGTQRREGLYLSGKKYTYNGKARRMYLNRWIFNHFKVLQWNGTLGLGVLGRNHREIISFSRVKLRTLDKTHLFADKVVQAIVVEREPARLPAFV
jgi:hypothetical protein